MLSKTILEIIVLHVLIIAVFTGSVDHCVDYDIFQNCARCTHGWKIGNAGKCVKVNLNCKIFDN